jgi:hypothetical protein
MMQFNDDGTPRDNSTSNAKSDAVHLHLHGVLGSINDQEEIDEGALQAVLERLEGVERAVALLAGYDGGEEGEEYEPEDDNGNGDTRAFTQGSERDPGSLSTQMAHQMVVRNNPAASRDQEASPGMSAADINRINEGYWANKGRTMTGGSGSTPPNSRASEGANYMPGKAGDERNLSKTANTLSPGRVWNGSRTPTTDHWRRLDRKANATINAINRANSRFYARGR